MRKTYIVTVLSAVFAAFSATAAFAQNAGVTALPGAATSAGITVSDVKMTSSPEGLRLDMAIDVTSGAVSNLGSISLVPTVADGAGNSAAFPYVLINGRNSGRMYERRSKLGNAGIERNPAYLVLTIDSKHTGEKIAYSASVASAGWMEGASLNIVYVLSSPAGEMQSYSAPVSGASAVMVPEAPAAVALQPAVTEMPPAPVVVVPQVQAPVVVAQPRQQPAVTRSEYRPVAANVRTLTGTVYSDQQYAAIAESMNGIAGSRVVAVTLTGYTSPEGNFDANMSISRDRAQSVARYLQEQYGIPASMSTVRGAGEDWEGLRAMVVASNLPYVGEIIKAIDGYGAPDVKESLLRRMMGGQIWQIMEREIFPPLRRVDYTIDYEAAE